VPARVKSVVYTVKVIVPAPLSEVVTAAAKGRGLKLLPLSKKV